jgi:hypothetical protein
MQLSAQFSQQARDSINKLTNEDHQLMLKMLGIGKLDMKFSFTQAHNTAKLVFNRTGKPFKGMCFKLWQTYQPISIEHTIGNKEFLILRTLFEKDFTAVFEIDKLSIQRISNGICLLVQCSLETKVRLLKSSPL